MLLLVETGMEGQPAEVSDGGAGACRKDKVLRLVLLKHPPHCLSCVQANTAIHPRRQDSRGRLRLRNRALSCTARVIYLVTIDCRVGDDETQRHSRQIRGRNTASTVSVDKRKPISPLARSNLRVVSSQSDLTDGASTSRSGPPRFDSG
jgi:hypothetical protein